MICGASFANKNGFLMDFSKSNYTNSKEALIPVISVSRQIINTAKTTLAIFKSCNSRIKAKPIGV